MSDGPVRPTSRHRQVLPPCCLLSVRSLPLPALPRTARHLLARPLQFLFAPICTAVFYFFKVATEGRPRWGRAPGGCRAPTMYGCLQQVWRSASQRRLPQPAHPDARNPCASCQLAPSDLEAVLVHPHRATAPPNRAHRPSLPRPLTAFASPACREYVPELQQKYVPTLLAGYQLWIPAHIVNFALVPNRQVPPPPPPFVGRPKRRWARLHVLAVFLTLLCVGRCAAVCGGPTCALCSLCLAC